MKTNGALTILVLGLALLAYVERDGQPSESRGAAHSTTTESFLTFSAQEVVEIRIQNTQRCIVLRRGGQSRAALDRILTILSQAQIVRRFSISPTEFAAYGLAPPERQVSLLRSDHTLVLRVSIGNTAPTGNVLYASTENATEVVLLGTYLLSALEMALQDGQSEVYEAPDCRPRVKESKETEHGTGQP